MQNYTQAQLDDMLLELDFMLDTDEADAEQASAVFARIERRQAFYVGTEA